jgi:hypothetical protein
LSGIHIIGEFGGGTGLVQHGSVIGNVIVNPGQLEEGTVRHQSGIAVEGADNIVIQGNRVLSGDAKMLSAFWQDTGGSTVTNIIWRDNISQGQTTYNEYGLPGWSSFTPTITAGSGSFTLVSADGVHRTVNKVTSFFVAITITTNGTAATSVKFTLPRATASQFTPITGWKNTTGEALAGWLDTTTTGQLRLYTGGYPGGSGVILFAAGSYQTASIW